MRDKDAMHKRMQQAKQNQQGNYTTCCSKASPKHGCIFNRCNSDVASPNAELRRRPIPSCKIINIDNFGVRLSCGRYEALDSMS